jgi:hypothetical protein
MGKSEIRISKLEGNSNGENPNGQTQGVKRAIPFRVFRLSSFEFPSDFRISIFGFDELS